MIGALICAAELILIARFIIWPNLRPSERDRIERAWIQQWARWQADSPPSLPRYRP